MTTEQYQEEVRRLRPALVAVARSLLTDGDAAEDAVQDTLLRLWQMHAGITVPMDGLAVTVTRHLCVDRLRRQRVQRDLSAADVHLSEEPSAEARVDRLQAVLQQLPVLQQTLLRLRHMEGMAMSDLARTVGMTEVAVRQALSRARRHLREQYIRQFRHEEDG